MTKHKEETKEEGPAGKPAFPVAPSPLAVGLTKREWMTTTLLAGLLSARAVTAKGQHMPVVQLANDLTDMLLDETGKP